jgi:signal transduction histidine kinase
MGGEPATGPVLTRLRQVDAQHDAFRRRARLPVCAVLAGSGVALAATARPHPGLTGAGPMVAIAGLGEARRAIGLLRDGELPGPSVLGTLTGQFQADSGIPCSFQTSGQPADLHPDARLALYRVTQEALTNIVKHSGSSRVEVHLAYGADGARLTIEDFRANASAAAPGDDGGADAPGGAGIPVAAGDGPGHGLTGMRERAELLGGTLTAAPTPAGFRVELHVPARA